MNRQTRRDVRSVLSSPVIYESFQRLVGARSCRRVLAREYLRLSAGQSVLDIGCGPGSMLTELSGVEYSGFDPSPEYIAAARKRFRAQADFRVAAVEEIRSEELGRFDVVMAQGVLHHIDDRAAHDLFALADAVLKQEGRLVTIDPCLSPCQPALARALIVRDRGQHVRTSREYSQLAEAHFSRVTVSERHDLLRLPYSHAILECRR